MKTRFLPSSSLSTLCLAALLACATQGAAAAGSDAVSETLSTQLGIMATRAQKAGYDFEANEDTVFVGALQNGVTARHTLRLDGGRRYKIIGACDDDCSDLDFKLLSGSSTVDTDYAGDATPIVDAHPGTRTTYTLEVQMERCRARSICFYSFIIASK